MAMGVLAALVGLGALATSCSGAASRRGRGASSAVTSRSVCGDKWFKGGAALPAVFNLLRVPTGDTIRLPAQLAPTYFLVSSDCELGARVEVSSNLVHVTRIVSAKRGSGQVMVALTTSASLGTCRLKVVPVASSRASSIRSYGVSVYKGFVVRFIFWPS
jgi:hypothetical protein